MLPRTKVFVGSLPPGSKPEELRRLFENYGVVTECDIMNRCGFVHMQTEDMAETAIKALNNTSFKGVNISVERGRMKERGSGGNKGGRPNGGGGGRMGGGMGGGGGGRGFNGGDRNGKMGGRSQSGGRFDRGDGLNMSSGNGNGGPMRRDRGGNGRPGPYGSKDRNMGNRRDQGMRNGGGMDRFDRGMDGPMPMMNNRGPMDRGMGGGGMMDRRFDDGGYGFSNEDRRGFALPERQMYPNDMGGQGGMFENRGPMGGMDDRRGGPPMRGAPFERRPPLSGMDGGMNDIFSRRGSISMGGGGMGGRGGFDRGGDNYNQSFPPLGGMNNRNGPPRRDMMNRRF